MFPMKFKDYRKTQSDYKFITNVYDVDIYHGFKESLRDLVIDMKRWLAPYGLKK